MERRQGLLRFTLAYKDGGEKTRISQVYSLYIEKKWRTDKDYSGLLLVYRERMEKRQGLFKFTSCI